jgi:hypothetical protein
MEKVFLNGRCLETFCMQTMGIGIRPQLFFLTKYGSLQEQIYFSTAIFLESYRFYNQIGTAVFALQYISLLMLSLNSQMYSREILARVPLER